MRQAGQQRQKVLLQEVQGGAQLQAWPTCNRQESRWCRGLRNCNVLLFKPVLIGASVSETYRAKYWWVAISNLAV